MFPLLRGEYWKVRLWSVVYRVVFASLLVSFFFQPALVWAEGFGPFPVRNFQPIQQLVLSMPGDRAAVVKKGVLDFRVELAETADFTLSTLLTYRFDS